MPRTTTTAALAGAALAGVAGLALTLGPTVVAARAAAASEPATGGDAGSRTATGGEAANVTATGGSGAPTVPGALVQPAALSVPDALRPPPGHAPTGSFGATGVQVYRCAGGAWTFVEPAATLAGRVAGARGVQAAIHFRGPSWQSTADGSLVEAGAVASSPVTGAIPELLLQARVNRGDGVFGRVSYIQRLATSGGLAPAGECADGATTGVPYRAVYRFFAPA